MMGLSPRQSQLLDFIGLYVAQHGISPNFQEMVGALGLKSKSNIHGLLTELEMRGHIRRIPSRARAIELTSKAREIHLNKEIHALTTRYALEHGISVETAANELLRGALGAAA